LQYGPDESRGEPGRGINASSWSYGVKWDSQMFYASLHQEIHYDTFGASTNIADATVRQLHGGQRQYAFAGHGDPSER